LTTSQASISASGTTGLCLFCSISNTSNVVDNNTATAATVSIPLGVSGAGYIEVNLGQTYTSGTRAGFLIDVNGGVAAALNSITITAYNNSTSVGSVSGSSLVNVVGLGGKQAVSGMFCSSYNKLRVSLGSVVGILAAYSVYGVFVEDQCNFPGACAGCNAGIIAPTLSTTSKANTCFTTTVDLTTITASNTPASTTLSWHTVTPCTAANVVGTPSAVAAGTYYAAFYDATNNCYSGSAATAVTATVNALPTVGANTGTTLTAVTLTTTLSNATSGGVWSSANTAIATVDASGVVTGVSANSVNISYTITNAFGCTASAITTVQINPIVRP
jgi:hypothetical protein